MTRYEGGWVNDAGKFGVTRIDRKGTVDHHSSIDGLAFDEIDEAHVAAKALQAAWQKGNEAAGIEGEVSLQVYNPYDADEETQLYEAWNAGWEARLGWA